MTLTVRVNFSGSANPSLSRLKFDIPQFFRDSGLPYHEENLYLLSIAKRLRDKSVRTVAEHVKELLEWRLNIGRDIADFSNQDLEYYIDAQCSFEKKKGGQLSWNTINSRAGGAHRFLIWCKINHFNFQMTLEPAPKNVIGATRRYKIQGHPSSKLAEPMQFLLMENAIKFILILSERSAANERTKIRNTLIAKLMLQCGLRVSEALAFPIFDLPEINHEGHSTPARVIGKGGKRRFILIPNGLLSELWAYVDITRAYIIEKLTPADAPALFITEKGKPITVNWIEKIFAKTGNILGIRVAPHNLRHTFGSYHYLYNRDLVFLSKLMGHESEVTTEKYYVHIAKLISYSGDYEQFQLYVDRACTGI